jgi:hypothetical protein
MNRIAILLSAVAVFLLALLNFVLGQNLIMPLEQAQERGAGPPWYLVWGTIWLTVVCSIALGVFLIGATLRSDRR